MARALFNELALALGRDLRFMDVGRDALAVLIGNDWLDASASSEQRRLNDPEDYVRREIEAALRRNISITPVLLNGAQMPRAEQLPDAIREFAYYGGFELDPNCWADNVRELFKRLGLGGQPNAESVFDAALSPQWVPSAAVPVPARPAVAQTYVPPSGQWRRFVMAGGVVLAMAIAGVHYYRGSAEGNRPRAEVLLAEAPRAEAPRVEAPLAEAPPAEALVADVPTVEAPLPETTFPETPFPEEPPAEATLTKVPPAEALVAEVPTVEAPLPETTFPETPFPEEPPAEATLTKVPPAEEAPAKVALAEAPLPEARLIEDTLAPTPSAEAPPAEAPLPRIPLPEARLTEATLTKTPPVEVPLSEVPLPEMPPAEVRLSEVLLDEAQLAEVRPREQRAINMNSHITLRSPDDRYVVNARSREKNYYYASLGSTAQVMALEAGDEPLVYGSSVTIQTTENWGGEWAGRTYLGAFGDRTELYYWDYYGAKTQWIIEKISGQRGDAIYSGDKVTIQNERFTGQYLTTHPDNYLTTTNRTPRAQWTIELAN